MHAAKKDLTKKGIIKVGEAATEHPPWKEQPPKCVKEIRWRNAKSVFEIADQLPRSGSCIFMAAPARIDESEHYLHFTTELRYTNGDRRTR